MTEFGVPAGGVRVDKYPQTILTLSAAGEVPPEPSGVVTDPLLAEDADAADLIASLLRAGRLEDIIDYVWPETDR
jgi:hypothetical protein